MAFPLVAAIGAGASLLGGAIGAGSQSSANKTNMAIAKMNNEYNERMQNQQNAYNLDMWMKQNDYNSPTAQLQRFKDAGLNPNLIYGGGSASAGNATSIQTESPKSAESVRVQPVNYFAGLSEGLNKGLDTMLQFMQYEQMVKKNEASVAQLTSTADLNVKRADLVTAQTATELARPDLIAKTIENLDQRTIHEWVKTGISTSFQQNSDSFYRLQVEAKQASIDLSRKQIEKLSNDIDVSIKRLDIEGQRLNINRAQIMQGIEYIKSGMTLRELQARYMRAGFKYLDAEKITNILGGVLSGAAKVATFK